MKKGDRKWEERHDVKKQEKKNEIARIKRERKRDGAHGEQRIEGL